MDSKRTQFTFYESIRASTRKMKRKSDRADFYDAVCDYALYGIEPDLERLPDIAVVAFIGIRPNLDASRKRAEAGKKGGENNKREENHGKMDEKSAELAEALGTVV